MGEPIAAYLLKKSESIVGVDGSANRLNLAKQKYPQAEWLVSDMRPMMLRNFQLL